MEHVIFIDSVSFLPCALRKLPETIGLTATKSWYSLYFNTEENLDYVGPTPDISYYVAKEMIEEETGEFLAWHDRNLRSSTTGASWELTVKMTSRF